MTRIRIPLPMVSALTLAVLSTELKAQWPTWPEGGWLFSEHYVAAELMDSSFQAITAFGGSVQTCLVAEPGEVYVYRGSPQVYRMDYTPNGAQAWSFGMNLLAQGPYARWAYGCNARDGIWMVDLVNGACARVGKGAANQVPVVVANLTTSQGLSGALCSVVTNGRELFYSVEVSAADSSHVFAMDIRDPAHPIRPLASLPTGVASRRGPTLALGRDGMLLAMDALQLYAINADSGAMNVIDNGPASFGSYAGSPGWQTLFAYDVWSDTRLVASTLPDPYMDIWAKVSASGNWALVYVSIDWGCALASTAVQPFELFGTGCNNSAGHDPRLGWTGLPLQGQSFTVNLRNAEQNGVAMMWLGWSDTFWASVGALPFNAGPLGAPGCSLLVAPDGPLPFLVDASGRASYSVTVPVNPSIAGMQVFAQSVSTSGANALGFASSDALIVRLR